MTDRSKLLALAEAVEKLSGPDRATNADIFQALNPTFLPVSDGRRFYDPETVSRLTAEKYITRGTYCTPNYTASLDAAMTLVPEGKDVMFAMIDGRAYAGNGKERSDADIEAATLPLALTAACLRAQAEALA